MPRECFVVLPHMARHYWDLLDQMFALRAKVFRQRLGWVDGDGEHEQDRYDRCDPVYLVHTDPSRQRLAAACRFLPMMGPTLLRDVFGETIPDIDIWGPHVWECSRLVLDEDVVSSAERIPVLRRMLRTGIAFGLDVGADVFLANFDDLRLAAFRRAGARIDVIGQTDGYSCGTVYLGLIEVSEAALEDVRGRDKRVEETSGT